MATLLFPRQGDFLASPDGILTEGGMQISLRFSEPCPFSFCGGERQTDLKVSVREGRNTVTYHDGKEQKTVEFFYCPSAEKGFRISVDDTILCLYNITIHEEYRSVFEDPFFALFKRAHDAYGLKVHFNLFYAFDPAAAAYFSTPRPSFNLTAVTDRFREELSANADWLRFSFHAKTEYPGDPYKSASYDTVRADAEAVNREIVRFAGERCLAPETTLHYCSATAEGVRALRDSGYRILSGDYGFWQGAPLLSYHLEGEARENLLHRDFWYDRVTDVTFAKFDIVLNGFTDPEAAVACLEEVVSSESHRAPFLEMMTHEQYFYPDYFHHIPAYEEVIGAVCRYCTGQEYTSRFFSDALKQEKQGRI